MCVSFRCCTRAYALDTRRSGSFLFAASLLFLGSLAALLSGCHSAPKLPEKGSKAYADVVSAFYVGLAALQVGDDVHAESKLSELTQLVPTEPAGWANWGVLALRQRNYDLAAQRLERARALAPQNDQIYDLLGILEADRGHSAEAIADLRKAVDLNPKNLRAAYALGEEIERQGDANSEREFQQVIQSILAAQPDNLAALLELSRVAAKRGDAATLKLAVAQISARSSAWPAEVQQQLATVQAAAAGTDLRAAATRTTFLRNVLMRVPEYRLSPTLCEWNRLSSSLPLQTRRSNSPFSQWRMLPIVTGTGLERSSSAAQVPPLLPKRMAGKSVCLPVQRFPFPVDRPVFRPCLRESYKSTSTTISKPIWCWRVPEACAYSGKTVGAHSPM